MMHKQNRRKYNINARILHDFGCCVANGSVSGLDPTDFEEVITDGDS